MISEFTMTHYNAALNLWRETSGIGVSRSDEPDSLAFYLARNPGTSFVAVANGALVGTILGGHDGRRGYIHHLAVHPDYRRQGIATQLVTKALASLEEIGIQKCLLFIKVENEAGRAFWQSSGWSLREDISMMSKFISKEDGSSC
jgi:putative acetyltransferase